MYLNYAFGSGWADNPGRRGTWFAKKFSLPEFLRRVPESSRQKAGVNLALIVVQILFLLEEYDFDAVAARIESLRLYVYRYLRREDTVRSRLFVKLLFIMDKCAYRARATREAAAQVFAELQGQTPDKQPALEEAEILPFEDVWERMLTKLAAHDWERR